LAVHVKIQKRSSTVSLLASPVCAPLVAGIRQPAAAAAVLANACRRLSAEVDGSSFMRTPFYQIVAGLAPSYYSEH
jgi:hypothetical protein